MNDKKSKRSTSDPPSERAFKREQYHDDSGIQRVVLVPPGETDLKTGIPVSLDLSPLFGHMPQKFQQEFYKALHDQGLIEPADYFKPGASERYRRALLTVIKHDFLNIQELAQQELNHG